MFSSYLFNETHKELCSGCRGCAQICPQHAITINEDSEGFLFPKINQSLCIQCGLCDKRCPANSKDHRSNRESNQKYWLITNKNRSDSKECATIGLCTLISKKAFELGFVVFGVKLDEVRWVAYHKRAVNISDITEFSNSKYIQSDTCDTFTEVKKALLEDKRVLYIGTPCQIAGLKAFLGKDYANLYTVDLICHGCYSYKLLEKEVGYWKSRYKGEILDFRFRSKYRYPWTIGGIINFTLLKKGKKKHIEILGPGSPSYYSFAYSNDKKNYNLREICYSCPFRDKNRYGDLTVGDAWGMYSKYPRIFTVKNQWSGISLVFSNTNKGQSLLRLVDSAINLVELNGIDVFCQDALIPMKREIPKQRYDLYNSLDKDRYNVLIEKLLNTNLNKNLKIARKKVRMQSFKLFVKAFILYDLWKKR